MGHVLLGSLPRTRKWAQVVGLIRGGAAAAQIANAVIRAAEQGLGCAANDKGVIETIWLLTQLPIAARSEDFATGLRDCGLNVTDAPSVMEIVGSVTEAIDAKMPNCKGRTDLGEMAQLSAVETLTEVIGGRVQSLFGTTSSDVQQAFAKLATNKQFSIFAKDFFSRFTYKCLDYFLSKTMADHIGKGERFHTLAEHGEFTKAMETHCKEASVIIEKYSGDWFSKTRWETDGQITREEIKAFTGYAMTKLVAELKQGASGNAK